MNVNTTVNREWAKRPDDERFLSLEELNRAVQTRADNSTVKAVDNQMVKIYGYSGQTAEDGSLVMQSELGPKLFTNWSFGQVAAIAGAPAGYLRKLDAPLAAANLNYGLQNASREQSALMVNGDNLRCATSPTYGRIWDYQVVNAVQNVTDGGPWKIPSASYASRDPKKATTLYASDRDVFIFLVDEEHPIELNGEVLYRGFYVWNSEVGSQVFGLNTFLYRTVCDNRMIWGMQHQNEIRIRHSSGAPERFVTEGKKALIEYSNASTKPIIEQIQRAQAIKVGNDEDEVKAFLKARGLSNEVAKSAIDAARIEENDIYSPWSLAQGITAFARSIPNTDNRVTLEREAGKLLDSVLK